MRTLSELRNMLTAVPFSFAENAQENVSDFANTESDATNYSIGFPSDYSSDPHSEGVQGKYILRNDMNAIGQMATRELHFKESGGLHTFSKTVSDGFGGYPDQVVLNTFDGDYLSLVESQENDNTKKFTTLSGLTDYTVVDCQVLKDGESEASASKRILWKNVSHIDGLDNALFHIEVDYSNAQQITDGEVVPFDCIVIGTFACFASHDRPGLNGIQPQKYAITASHPLYHKTTISQQDKSKGVSLEITNKGRFGDAFGSGCYLDWTNAGLSAFDIPICSYTGGTGNYFFSAFTKKGTKFVTELKYRNQRIQREDGSIVYPYWWAIPFIVRIGE